MEYRIIYLVCYNWIFWQVVNGQHEDDHAPYGDYPPVAMAGYIGPQGSVSHNSSIAGDAEDHDKEDDHEEDSDVSYQHEQQPFPYPAGNTSAGRVKDQHYGQPYAHMDYRSHRNDPQNYVRTVHPSMKSAPYMHVQYNRSAVPDQHYGQPHVGQYSGYRRDTKNYAVKIDPAVRNAYYIPAHSAPVQYQQYGQSYAAAQGGYPAAGDFAYKSVGLCTISETPVDKSVYCGLPNLKIVTGHPIDPVKLRGEWYSYRHSPTGPAVINHVLRVHILGQGTQLPATNFPGLGVWGVLSGFRGANDAVCSDHFYVGFVTPQGTQVVEDYRPGRARIEPTVYQTLYLDERRGVWLNYECARYNAVTGVCAVPNLCIAVRERPDRMSRDDQSAVDAAVNQVLAPYCMNVGQLPKQIYTNHKGTCPQPAVPKWLAMKIRGIGAYNRKIDLS